VAATRTTEREPLSRDRVLDAAAALADAEGLPAVTMRRLAADLGVEAMSLYHHLPGKGGLLDGLVETVIVEIEAELARTRPPTGDPDSTGSTDGTDWRDDVRRRCLSARTVMVRHPWAPGLISSRPTIPPAAYGYYEALLGSMIRGGLTYHLGHRALHSLGSMALGFAQEVFSPADSGGDLDPEAAEAEFAAMAEVLPYMTAMAASEMHDGLARAQESPTRAR
jgi:AcrR family transcriptional regulator